MLVFVGVRQWFFLLNNTIVWLSKGIEAIGFEKILDVFYLWLDPERTSTK